MAPVVYGAAVASIIVAEWDGSRPPRTDCRDPSSNRLHGLAKGGFPTFCSLPLPTEAV